MLLNDALKKIQILFAEKNYVLALAKINKILKKNKQNLDLINNKSSILIAMERIDEAHNELQKIIKIEPNFIEAYINLGIVYHKKKLHKKAIDSYERALEIDKKSLQSIFNLASLYLEIDQCELALEKLNSIYVEAYSIDYFHQLMAECYIRELNYDKALAHHIIATEKNPNNPLNWFLLGVDYVWAGDKSNAEYNFMQAIKLNPKYAEAYFALTKVKDIDISNDHYRNRVIVPIQGINHASIRALRYAKTISDNVVAFNVAVNEENQNKIKEDWKKLNIQEIWFLSFFTIFPISKIIFVKKDNIDHNLVHEIYD